MWPERASTPPTADYGAAEFAAEFTVPPARMADMERFRQRVAETNQVMNLVGPATLPAFWRRHAQDSAQLLKIAAEARVWADLGAGAGFPGVVLAILMKGRRGAHVHLIDSLSKRCRFLDDIIADLDLPATVHNARAEALAIETDIVTARACAPFDRLLGYARPYLSLGATGLFLKGETAEQELKEAQKSWSFDAELLPSLSDPRGRVVRLRRLSRAK